MLPPHAGDPRLPPSSVVELKTEPLLIHKITDAAGTIVTIYCSLGHIFEYKHVYECVYACVCVHICCLSILVLSGVLVRMIRELSWTEFTA